MRFLILLSAVLAVAACGEPPSVGSSEGVEIRVDSLGITFVNGVSAPIYVT
jgi:hypothetical protein